MGMTKVKVKNNCIISAKYYQYGVKYMGKIMQFLLPPDVIF